MAAAVEDLRRRVAQLEHIQTAPISFAPKPAPATPAIPKPSAASPAKPTRWLSGEFWLNMVGIALVLLALAFFFNYAVQQGWLVPVVRLAIGAAAGVLLLGLGLFLRARRPDFATILQGGGLAAFYITGYASLNLYNLAPYEAAFGAMTLTTLAAYGLAARQKAMPLAFIALIGGLITPLVLESNSKDITAWLVYSSMILACACALYYWQRWSLLLYVAAAAGYIIASIATGTQNNQSLVVQTFIFVMLGLFWLMPLLRTWRNGQPPANGTARHWGLNVLFLWQIPYAMLLSAQHHDFEGPIWGRVLLSVAAILAAIAAAIWRASALRPFTWSHTALAGAFFAVGVGLVSESWAWVTAAIMAAVLAWVWLRQHIHSLPFDLIIYVATVVGLLTLTGALGEHVTPLRRTPTLTTALPVMSPLLLAIGLLSAAAFWLRNSPIRVLYAIASYIFGLAWLAVAAILLPSTQAVISAVWGLIGIMAVLFGLRRNDALWRSLGFATLALVVGKLFVVDLAEVALLVRVGLFLLLGVAFLLLSYFYRAARKA